ncbi:hypothetical protein PC9H_008269 [Pleurotus ostreatus]|uniref:Uncharacterized protein n=1 Tax=Pleurotus ostreatus TaxID=5322 RepID=A0A8H7DQZ1_PLEOS|nr:uncharacterized protein PC9H_008269 [Pleurotus ostreatus]KAF7429031.1 hypothetical protein PC9H_008269 [Pleurotus ostreatus]
MSVPAAPSSQLQAAPQRTMWAAVKYHLDNRAQATDMGMRGYVAAVLLGPWASQYDGIPTPIPFRRHPVLRFLAIQFGGIQFGQQARRGFCWGRESAWVRQTTWVTNGEWCGQTKRERESTSSWDRVSEGMSLSRMLLHGKGLCQKCGPQPVRIGETGLDLSMAKNSGASSVLGFRT